LVFAPKSIGNVGTMSGSGLRCPHTSAQHSLAQNGKV
jgi:hypothetical protein